MSMALILAFAALLLLTLLALLWSRWPGWLKGVLVVAVTIILVKFGSLAEVRAQPGTILFCVGVLLSMAAGLCVRFDEAVEVQP